MSAEEVRLKSCSTTLAILSVLYAGSLLLSVEPASAGRLNESLSSKAAETPQESVTALVFLSVDVEESLSLSALTSSIGDFGDRYRTAYKKIRSASNRALDNLVSELHTSDLELEIGRSFWIANAVEVTARLDDLARLAEFNSVEIIVEDTVLQLVEPVEVSMSASSTSGFEPNLAAVNADDLWAMGLTGAGRLVLSFDTGVDGGHPGLASRWRGLTAGNPSAGWYDPFGTVFPEDNVGHGTHVMGIVAGLYYGDTIGVAPDVEWGCAAVVDRGVGFSQTISDILLAFEWAANPDGDAETTDDVPDAICHSWGVPRGVFGPCDNTFWQAIDNLEQLGVVNVFACGNEGPEPATIRNPADRATSPLNSFSVGAVDQRDSSYPVASFSSRGPANCDSTAMKPEIVAPGVSIRSLYPNNTTRQMTGTSMASPHVAGAVALLRQYNPDATADQIKHALLMSARDVDEPGEDNASGFGLIDLARALEYMPEPVQAIIQYRSFEIIDNGNHIIEPLEAVQLTVNIEVNNFNVTGLWGMLHTYDTNVAVISDSAYFGSYSEGVACGNQTQPFEIQAGQFITPGKVVTFRIDFYDQSGKFLNNAYFDVVLAQSQEAASGSISNSRTSVGSCNYGIIGLGPGSLVDMGQAGFSVDSTSYLAEFALVISDDEGRVSDAARDMTGGSSDNDFVADSGASFTMDPVDSWGDTELAGAFSDGLAEDPIGVAIEQRVSLFNEEELGTTAFVLYSISGLDPLSTRTLCAGVMTDIDFPDGDVDLETLGFDHSRNLIYYYNPSLDSYVGTGILSQSVHSLAFCTNPFGCKVGLSDSTKWNMLNSGQIPGLPSKRGDYAHVMSIAPRELSGDEILSFAVAIIWAESETELLQSYDYAYQKYNTPSHTDQDRDARLPHGYSLFQNYPNPFNPRTTIRFSIGRAQHVSLTIFNALGQQVSTLFNRAVNAGTHEVVWGGTDDSGNLVASGVYFYRLETAVGCTTRKMLLVK